MRDAMYDFLFQAERTHWWYRVRRSIVIDLVAALRRERGGPLALLDIGCGTGLLMQELAPFGKVEGIDISERAVTYCRARGLAPAIGSAAELPYPDDAFDAVIMLDVLEHLEDDRAGMREVARVLKRGGIAIIAVPAFRFLWGVTDELSHHYRRYTRKEGVALARKSGLSVRRATYFNTFLFPAIAAVRLLARLLRVQRESETFSGRGLANALFYWIFALEAKVLRVIGFPFGVSVLMIAEKDRHGF